MYYRFFGQRNPEKDIERILVDLLGTGGVSTRIRFYTFTIEDVLTVNTGKIRLYNRTGDTLTILEVFAAVNTASSGANIILDINQNGTSIWNATPANRVTITAGANTGSQTAFDTSQWTNGNYLTLDVDQRGSLGTEGYNLTVMVKVL